MWGRGRPWGVLGGRVGRLDRCGCGWLSCVLWVVWPASWRSLKLLRLWRPAIGACVGVSRSVVVVHLSMWLRFGVELA